MSDPSTSQWLSEHGRVEQLMILLHGDATIAIATDVGHVLAPVLVERALFRLRNHIPHRTWAAALGMVPGLAHRQGEGA